MKLRYYMRGLGIGIVVTAILLSISLRGRTKPMSDDQVIARAKELGMEEKYETAVLADGLSENSTDGQTAQAGAQSNGDQKADAQQAQTGDTDSRQPDGEKTDEENKDAGQEAPDAEDGQSESTDNTQAQDALDRAEQAKEEAKNAAEQAAQKADGIADGASQLKVGKDEPADVTDAAGKHKTGDGKNVTGQDKTGDGKASTGQDKTDDGKTSTGQDKTGDGKTSTVQDKTGDGKTSTAQDKTGDGKTSTTQSGTGAAGKGAEVTVGSGEGSYQVAKKLEAAGVIDDSGAFDDYLCQNGYDRRITPGKHTIKAGATREEIAKELTTKVAK